MPVWNKTSTWILMASCKFWIYISSEGPWQWMPNRQGALIPKAVSVPGSRTLPHCCTALKIFCFFHFFIFIFLQRRDESDNLLLSHFPTAAVCRATRTPSECEMRSGDGLLVCQSAQRRISPNDGRDSLRTKQLHQTWKTTQLQAK